MKRFLIHADTNWCGEEDTFRAVAESEIELWDIAEQLAYDYESKMSVVSEERIREELVKCFKCDTL